MAIYRVDCGLCGNDNIHEATSDAESLQKHNESKSHTALATDWKAHLSNVTSDKGRK